jgi:hypothetical protein
MMLVLATVSMASAQDSNVSPEASALRMQYQNWASDNGINSWVWISVVGKDLKRAAQIIVYDKLCGRVEANQLRYAGILLNAFPEYVGMAADAAVLARDLINADRDRGCRSINRTPLPPAP